MYRKTMKRWLSGMLLFALVLGLGAPASANLLYTAQTYYTDTVLGKVVGDTATVLTPNSIGGDWGQGIFPFEDRLGRSRVAVTLYEGETDTINILDPAALSWTSPVQAISGQDHSLSNIRKMVSLGDYLYGISYGNNPYGGQPSDIAQVRRFKFNMSNDIYVADGNASFTYTPAAAQGHGEGLAAYGSNIFAILTMTTGSYPNFDYGQNKLVKLGADLEVVLSVDMVGRNTDGGTPGAYCQDGNLLYITSWGGNQPVGPDIAPYRVETLVESVDLSSSNLTHANCVRGSWMKSRDVNWNHYFTGIAVANGNAYVQASRWNDSKAEGLSSSRAKKSAAASGLRSGGEVRLYVVSADQLGLLSGDHKVQTISFNDGWRLGLNLDENYLYVAAGSNLYRYTLPVTAESVATVFGPDGTSLGGDISAFASVPSLRGVSAAQAAVDGLVQAKAAREEKGDGRGCDAGLLWGWLLLLAAVPVALRRRG